MEAPDPAVKDTHLREAAPGPSNSGGQHVDEPGQCKPVPLQTFHPGSQEVPNESPCSPENKIAELLKGKEQEWTAVASKKGPLTLLDLPLDILEGILNEVTHTNDLTAVALTCSSLHTIVTPMIYSRFDIVWPDASSSSEPRSGVDALTFGLATLVMRADLFEKDRTRLTAEHLERLACTNFECIQCGANNRIPIKPDQPPKPKTTRRGNLFSHYTKKFSLGNGPADWVQEYLVTKESGKMLGTLICLAVARMPNLETFVWDMPTGILRDIWTSLSSLGDYEPIKLSKVWVRLHDNKAAFIESGATYPEYPIPNIPNLDMTNVPLSELPGFSKLKWAEHPVERPNFSKLPPLKSLTVLTIDEVSYLDELSKLIGKSRKMLRELRIGLAPKIYTSGYKAENPVIQCFCLGTELSLLFNEIDDTCDPRSKNYIHRDDAELESQTQDLVHDTSMEPADVLGPASPQQPADVDSTKANDGPLAPADISASLTGPSMSSNFDASSAGADSTIDPALTHPSATGGTVNSDESTSDTVQTVNLENRSPETPIQESSAALPQSVKVCKGQVCHAVRAGSPRRAKEEEAKDIQLRLETLELEGCSVRLQSLRAPINLTALTSLTLLNCAISNTFWTDLGRLYPPTIPIDKNLSVSSLSGPQGKKLSVARLRRMPSMPASQRETQYPLSLKRIHTDSVSADLIEFLKEFLAPNSLEWLFLQDTGTAPSIVDVNTICKGPIRRHRSSLTKLLIDSSVGPPGTRPRSTSASKWMLGREALTFLTSGKLSKLRELAMVVEYKDWHFVLQRLPNIPHLRSLYVPQIMNHVYNRELNIKELAMGVLDVVSLRPEIELCYLGVSTKCFELLEKKSRPKKKASPRTSPMPPETEGENDTDNDNTTTSVDDDDDDDGEDENGSGTADTSTGEVSQGGDGHDAGEDGWSTSEAEECQPVVHKVDFKLREILFYDDKISIFKARHGRL